MLLLRWLVYSVFLILLPSFSHAVEVDLFTGDATYQLPIEVPAGTNKVGPSLALVYNSHRGNGWVGEGWNLQGLGFVERLGENWSPAPGYLPSDTFRLHFRGASHKLISDPAAGYFRTETETFLRIYRVSDPAQGFDYWLVVDRDGTKFYFGDSSDSRQRGVPPEGVTAYHLNKMTDSHGNFYTVSYDQDTTNLDMYPKQIFYTQGNGLACTPSNVNDCRVIDFIFEPRPDVINNYRGSVKVTTDKRLKRVDVKLGGRLVRDYDFAYEPSLVTARRLSSVSQLKSVTEHGPGGIALQAYIFTYNQDQNASNLSLNDTTLTNSPTHHLFDCVYPVDMNNDGFTDILVGNQNAYVYYRNQGGTGFETAINLQGNFPSLCSTRSDIRRNTDRLMKMVNLTNKIVWAGFNFVADIITGGEGTVGFTPGESSLSFEVLVPVHDSAIIDLDGDRLPDVLHGATMEAWKWWRNQGNDIFAAEAAVGGSPPVTLDDRNVRFVDMDADGLIDVVKLTKQQGENRNTGTSVWDVTWWKNKGNGQFSETSRNSSHTIHISYPDGSVRQGKEWPASRASDFSLIDMSGDGLPDLVWNVDVCPCDWDAPDPNNPGYTTYINQGIIYHYYPLAGPNGSNPRVTMRRSDGSAFPQDEPLILADMFADMNGDGWPDIVVGAIPEGGGYYYYPNEGGISFGLKVMLNNDPQEAFAGSNHFALADVNGDGFIDILKGDSGNYHSYWLDMSDNHRGMETIRTPLGGTTTAGYQRRRIEQTGMSRWVVNQIVQDSGISPASTVNYTYSGGKYVGWPWNEFRGFAQVQVTEPPDHNGQRNYTIYNFYQDDATKGLLSQARVRNSTDKDFTVAAYFYETAADTPVIGVRRVDLSTEVLQTWDGAEMFKQRRVDYNNYDSYGNAKSVTTSGTGIISRITTTDFVYNTTNYIVNRPSHTKITVDGTTISESWFNYDGQINGAAPSKGDLTLETRWLAGGNPVTQYFYDSFGNRIRTIDPNWNICAGTGFTTTIQYDETYRTFPITETNALCQSTTKTYWGVGASLDKENVPGASDVPGLLATVTDPNNVTMQYYWDVHSRPRAKVIPPDIFQSPTQLWSYNLPGTFPNFTLDQQLDGSSLGGGTLERITYVDGFNRTIQTKSEAEAPGQWITQDTIYNSRGLVESVSIPYITTDIRYSDPVSQPRTTTLYDAVRRPIQVTNPDGTVRTIGYDRWVVTQTDEKNIKTVISYDAQDRLVSLREDAPSGPITLYSYDNFLASGENLQQIIDVQNNVTQIILDSLGRSKRQCDPDLGCWDYIYDLNGNLLRQTDAKQQVTIYTYDKLNRVKTTITSPADNTPPILSAIASGNISTTAATISWTTDEISDSQVEYGTSTTYGRSTPLDSNLVTSHGIVLPGLSSTTLYHYRVKSRDVLGNLAISADFTFTTSAPPDTTPPTAPSNLAATVVSSTQINLTWTASTDNIGVTGYRVERCQGASCTNFAQIATPTGASFNNTGLTAGTTYRYQVRAADAAGNLSAYSNIANATTTANPVLTLSKAGTGAGSVTSSPTGISCGATCSASFASATSVTLTATATTGSTFAGFSGGCTSVTTTCTFTITANATVTATFNDTQVPTAPTGLTAAVASSTQISLTWTASTDNVGVTGYRVERCQGASCTNFAQIATPTGASFNNTGLTAGTTYRYRVRAADAAGNLSAYSNIVSATTTASDTTPPTISNVAAGSITSSGATITWTTNEASDTQVEYGTTTAYGNSTTLNTAMVTSHSATLSGLSASTLYHYRVKSRDAAGNLATSADFTFTTSAGTTGIDLIMTSVIGPNSGQMGGSIVITNVVNNQGSSAAGFFEVRLMLSTDQTITSSDTVLTYRNVNSLAAGASNSANTTVTLPNGMTPGTYYLGAIVDIQNLVSETNETNNSLAGNAIAIVIGEDLVITAVSGPSSGQRGTNIIITNTAKNQGTGQAGFFEVRLFLSPDQTITASDTVLGYRNVSSLAAGVSNSANTTVTIPSGLTPGTYYIGAIADTANVLPEDNETNNSLAGNTINVTP